MEEKKPPDGTSEIMEQKAVQFHHLILWRSGKVLEGITYMFVAILFRIWKIVISIENVIRV